MTVLRDLHQHFVPFWREIRVIKKSVRFCKCILPDGIGCHACIRVQQVDISAGSFHSFEAGSQLVHDGLYPRLKSY